MQPNISDRYTDVALDLLRQSGQVGGATRLPVTGTSMLPLLQPGDAVWLQSIDLTALRPGDLLLIRQHGVLLTHRLIAVGPERWQTKGDNNPLPDPPITAQQIVGRIVTVERGGTSLDLRRRPWRIASRLLAWSGRIEERCQTLQHPRFRRLAYVVDAPFRLVTRAIVGVAARL
ncbi:MAG: hypothetical protein JOZ51_26030 [Chloroflexi bacterium]|nr:hypothetical protein [Chloroflexota bacterium]